jgi:D-psicose/D-tagatose/L-ribulose 3-epimerase
VWEIAARLTVADATVELLDEPNVTIYLDTYHLNIEEKGISAGFRATAGRCAYVHLSESDRGVPGTGTIDWDDRMRTVAELKFEGRLFGEVANGSREN